MKFHFVDCENKRVVLCNCEMGVIFQRSLFEPSSSIVLIGELVALLGEGCEAFATCLVESR